MSTSSTVLAAGPRARRRVRPHGRLVRSVLVITVVTVTLFASGCRPEPTAAPPPLTASSSQTVSPAVSSSPDRPAGSSLVATARGARVSVQTTPGGTVTRTLANPTAIGAPLTFLVLDARADWVHVALPLRPNGSSGWIARADVTLSSTPYRLIISMSKHRLDVERDGRRIARHPVGVGTSSTPTPAGTYYLTELIQPPDPAGAYGPYAFGLSAFSTTLTSFAGGPGQLGLHGTDAPAGLGHDVSHGCLRVANAVITLLAQQVPLGTPLEIRA